jgi:Arc/MetJ-type ribon-helix-helix transcriptional regulator
MTTKKISISLPTEVAERIRVLADEGHDGNLSALVGDLIEHQLRFRDSLEAVTEWEAEHGPLTEDELRHARDRWLA